MSKRISTELICIDAEQEICLNGVLWKPDECTSKTSIALFPGTGGEFFDSLFLFLGPRLADAGYMTLSLNRRDHGSQSGFHSLAASAGDHGLGIDFLVSQGAEKIILGGHSYGTVTVPFYVAETNDLRVAAMLLYAPLGDLRSGSIKICGGIEKYQQIVKEAKEKVASGQGSDVFLIPPMVEGGIPLLQTYSIFLDKRGPESKAVPIDILKNISHRKILGVRDPADPYPATLPPSQEKLEAANSDLVYFLLDDTRNGNLDADAHYFKGREEEVLEITLNWIRANKEFS